MKVPQGKNLRIISHKYVKLSQTISIVSTHCVMETLPNATNYHTSHVSNSGDTISHDRSFLAEIM